MITALITKLKTILEANTLIQKVYEYEKENPEGTPFVTITPSGNESEYNTTSENIRNYAFLVRIFIERSTNSTKAPECEEAMAEVVDSVLDDLDKNWRMSGVTVPTGYTLLMMSSAPSKWAYAGRENEYRVAEINVKVMTSVDVYSIT